MSLLNPVGMSAMTATAAPRSPTPNPPKSGRRRSNSRDYCSARFCTPRRRAMAAGWERRFGRRLRRRIRRGATGFLHGRPGWIGPGSFHRTRLAAQVRPFAPPAAAQKLQLPEACAGSAGMAAAQAMAAAAAAGGADSGPNPAQPSASVANSPSTSASRASLCCRLAATRRRCMYP